MAAKANFNAYHNYAIDSLHQWDRNQVLTLRGLNLVTAPEVHFSNKNMDRAIVRQASMVNHVVTVNIPNSLLQDPLRIYAHIGIYEGRTFTVVETVEIPVIPRARPEDYQIEDSDGEVYSFNRLENMMANMATKDQLANIVAGVGSDAELVDVRYGADGVTYASAGEAVRTQIENAVNGTASNFNEDAMNRIFSKAVTLGRAWTFRIGQTPNWALNNENVRATSAISQYWRPIKVVPVSGYRVSVIFLDEAKNCVSETGWTAAATDVSAGQRFAVNICKADNSAMTESEAAGAVSLKIVENVTTAGEVIASASVEHGRVDGASYTFLRIPYISNGGHAIRPRLALTSADGSLTGAKRSPLRYAQDNEKDITINAGLFNVTTNQPVGQTIIGGVSIVDTPMADDNGAPISATECYPLCIDGAGMLSAPYARNVSTADMIADGIVQAITGWGKLVEDFAVCSADIDAETVHPGKYIRQCVGQFQNGDYCVLTVDQARGAVLNEAGLTYEQCAQLLVDKGVKFAYSLDGGGSAATVLGKRQLNPIYEGTTGRAVPTIITFEIQ